MTALQDWITLRPVNPINAILDAWRGLTSDDDEPTNEPTNEPTDEPQLMGRGLERC
jgi:hypothetical protein